MLLKSRKDGTNICDLGKNSRIITLRSEKRASVITEFEPHNVRQTITPKKEFARKAILKKTAKIPAFTGNF